VKLLAATAETQGERANDFAWCIPGEVVVPVPVNEICDRDREDPGGGCGCGRSFAGLSSHKATTTAIVRDIDGYTFEDLLDAVRASRHQAGLAVDNDGVQYAAEIAETAAEFDDGDVLEIRLGEITPRHRAH
jgi:hypothetical protein